MNIVELRGLSKHFAEREIFSGLDISVHAGEVVAILGPSGCGKSTILRCIAGLLKPDGGWVYVKGETGFVFQEPRLFPWLRVRDNVAFGARNAAEHARVDELLDLVGLGAAGGVLPKHLSGGMAQRAALARALVRSPQLLLLDEPLAALDALRRMELQQALRSIITSQRLSAIIVTHDVDEAVALADRVVVLSGSPARKVAEIEKPDRESLLAALGIGPAAGELEVQSERVFVRAILGGAVEREDAGKGLDREALSALLAAQVPYADLSIKAEELSFSVAVGDVAAVRTALSAQNVAVRLSDECTRLVVRSSARNAVRLGALLEVLERAGIERLYAAESDGAATVVVRAPDLARARRSLEESFGIAAA